MIGFTFSLAGMLVFMLMIMLTDFIHLVSSISSAMEESFGHDTLIYPDHKQ